MNSRPLTCLIYALYMKADQNTIKLLIKSGADPKFIRFNQEYYL